MPDATLTSDKTMLRRKILGVRIRHARTRAGLNQREVGEALGISADSVSDIEFGRRHISLPHLEVLALIFNVPVGYFWSEDAIDEPNLDFPTQEATTLRQRIIGTLLRQARTKAGRTQDEAAELLDISSTTLSDYEYGKTEIPLQDLESLSDFLKVSLDYFLDEGITPRQPESNGQTQTTTPIDRITDYSQLPPDIREFLSNPANLLYVNIAMKLSELSAETLRAMAEGLLEVTY